MRLSDGFVDAVAFGNLPIANLDPPDRFRRQAPLNQPDQATFYGSAGKGYVGDPALVAPRAR